MAQRTGRLSVQSWKLLQRDIQGLVSRIAGQSCDPQCVSVLTSSHHLEMLTHLLLQVKEAGVHRPNVTEGQSLQRWKLFRAS